MCARRVSSPFIISTSNEYRDVHDADTGRDTPQAPDLGTLGFSADGNAAGTHCAKQGGGPPANYHLPREGEDAVESEGSDTKQHAHQQPRIPEFALQSRAAGSGGARQNLIGTQGGKESSVGRAYAAHTGPH